jgi:hypothetical protein
MGFEFNRLKTIADAKVLRDYPDIKAAHKAWTKVILDHQSEYYGKMYYSATPKSIAKKGHDFFKVWGPWPTAAKLLHDDQCKAVGFQTSLLSAMILRNKHMAPSKKTLGGDALSKV